MAAILAYTSLGTKLYLDGFPLEQIQMIVLDTTTRRIRLRAVREPGCTEQDRLMQLKAGDMVYARLVLPDGTVEFQGRAELAMCRLRIRYDAAARIVAFFKLGEAQRTST